MMIEAELVGGPCDGKRLYLQEEQSCEVVFSGFSGYDRDEIKYLEYRYKRRKINGICVRLPNGWLPYDYVDSIELKRSF